MRGFYIAIHRDPLEPGYEHDELCAFSNLYEARQFHHHMSIRGHTVSQVDSSLACSRYGSERIAFAKEHVDRFINQWI
jgi:hypothetical protein